MDTVEIIGFPMDLGASTRGVDMGPSATRIAGLTPRIKALGYQVFDRGNVKIPISSRLQIKQNNMKYLDEILAAAQVFAGEVEDVLEQAHIPVLLGGDHSMALGSLAGIAAFCRKHQKSFGVIWVDAHTDMNTHETTPSGNVHGMPLAASLGLGHEKMTDFYGFSPKILPEHTALIGIRSVDRKEMENTRALRLPVYTMSDIDRRGMYEIIFEVIEKMKPQVDYLHVSFDMDSLDPEFAPGVGTPVPGGLTFREAHLLMEALASSGRLASVEITEVNPILDVANKTAEVAVSLVESALGKRIL